MLNEYEQNNKYPAPDNNPEMIRSTDPSEESPFGDFGSQEALDRYIESCLSACSTPDNVEYPCPYEIHKLASRLDEMGVKAPEEAIHRVIFSLSDPPCVAAAPEDDSPDPVVPPGEDPEYWFPADESLSVYDIEADMPENTATEIVVPEDDASEDGEENPPPAEVFPTPDDGMPPMYYLSEFRNALPQLADELIQGILRVGHKMLIAGPSKAGKTFLLMYLAIAIAEGIDWLKFKCKKGKVLYINLEIDEPSAIHRLYTIYDALGIPPKNDRNIVIWNLRGHAETMDKLVPIILRRLRKQHFDAIIIDPIYKVIMGDENTATDMGKFCNEFDKLCTELGCSVIMCHHHSKGAQGGKKSMDRSSGSGVFARDPDAILDVVELAVPDELRDVIKDPNATAWKMESTLREFANIKPVNILFQYPLHKVDESGLLESVYPEGSPMKNLSKSSKFTKAEERRESIVNAYAALEGAGPVKIRDMAQYLHVNEGTVRNRINELNGEFIYDHGFVTRKSAGESKIVPFPEPQDTD